MHHEVHKKTRTLFLAVTLCSLCLLTTSLCGQSAERPTSETHHIRGTVVNRVTHEPIPRALVSSPDNRFATMTDGEGHFEFSFPVAHPPDNTTLNGPISTEVFNPNENGPGSL